MCIAPNLFIVLHIPTSSMSSMFDTSKVLQAVIRAFGCPPQKTKNRNVFTTSQQRMLKEPAKKHQAVFEVGVGSNPKAIKIQSSWGFWFSGVPTSKPHSTAKRTIGRSMRKFLVSCVHNNVVLVPSTHTKYCLLIPLQVCIFTSFTQSSRAKYCQSSFCYPSKHKQSCQGLG